MNSNNCRSIFYAFNKKWKSISECCKHFEVRYGFVGCKSGNGCLCRKRQNIILREISLKTLI